MVVFQFETSDGTIEVDGELLKCSVVIQNMMQSCSNKYEGSLIPLWHTSSSTIKLFIEWANHYKDDPSFGDSTNEDPYIEMVPDWDNQFFASMDNENLYRFILLANFFHITKLLKHVTKFVANMLGYIKKVSNTSSSTDATSNDEENEEIKQSKKSDTPTKKRARTQKKNDEDDGNSKVKRKMFFG